MIIDQLLWRVWKLGRLDDSDVTKQGGIIGVACREAGRTLVGLWDFISNLRI